MKKEWELIKNIYGCTTILMQEEDAKETKNAFEVIEKSLKALDIIMDLLGRHCKIELVNGGTYYQIKIKIMGSGYSFGMSITKEEFDLLKEVLE